MSFTITESREVEVNLLQVESALALILLKWTIARRRDYDSNLFAQSLTPNVSE